MFLSLVIILIIFSSWYLIKHIIKYRNLKFDNMILRKQVDEIRNNFKLYRSISDCENKDIDRLRNQNTELIMENMQLKSLIGAYRNTFGSGFHSTYSTQSISKDAVDAVRYAMKHAHPDNGGNAEDFIRFQKCYEELTRK